jgi:peptidyl-prolyl cis-trans isomerase C
MSDRSPESRGEYAYHLLRAAQERFRCNPAALSPEQLEQAHRQAVMTFELEQLVLDAPEARGLVIGETQLDASLAEIAGRYPDPADLQDDLARNGLDAGGLRAALRRELVFDAVMAKVAARAPKVGELDLLLFYELHRERFMRPERRTVRQILITVNESFAENTAEQARARIERLAERLGGSPQRFAALARRHSECPSAMHGGRLGEVTRGQLYPELDAVVFALAQGEISPVVTSELGFHLVWCEKIHPELQPPFAKIRAQVESLVSERQRRNCQKAWLAELRRSGADRGSRSGSEPEDSAPALRSRSGGSRA